MHNFGIGVEKQNALLAKMHKYGIRESDLVENFIRSAGAGGQNVNKVATCVYLKHIPTGTVVKCQKERSQALNRYLARTLLVKKIENRVLGRDSEERKRVEKIRRQKRKRSRRAKLKVLESKRLHSSKKSLRVSVRSNSY